MAVDFTDPEDLPYLFTDSLSVHRTWLPWADDEEEATVQLADRLQDDVLDELWGQAWPACRGHEHPARPCAIDGKAVWVCPTTGDILWAIGSVRP